MVAWGAATICTPALTKYANTVGILRYKLICTDQGSSGAGFAALRFFTGLAEAPFFPGITLSKCRLESVPRTEHTFIGANGS